MAIAKDNVILASDINAKNKTRITFSASHTGRNLGRDEWRYTKSVTPRDGLDYNVNFKLESSGASEERTDLEIWNEAGTVQYLEWNNGDGAPDLNVNNWPYLFDGSSEYTRFILVPEGTYSFRLGTGASIPKAKVAIRLYQGQTGISQGDDIRVWNSSWSSLLTKGATIITAALGNAGRLGTE